MAHTEQRPLLSMDAESADAGSLETHRTILGTEVINDADGWQYIVVFNRVASDTEMMTDPQDVLHDCFSDRTLEAWTQEESAFFDKVQENSVTKAEFYEACWKRITTVMSGKACGFTLGYKPSIDQEQVLLFIKLESKDTINQLADRLDIKIATTPVAYNVKGMFCPKVARSVGQILGLNKTPQKYAPVYLKYESARKEEFKAAANDRIKKAEQSIDSLLVDWNPNSVQSKALIRRLMRLEDVRAAVMVVLVDRIRKSELHRDQQLIKKHHELFNEMNIVLEKNDVDLQYEMEQLDNDQLRLQARTQRWSPPKFPDLYEYTSADLYDSLTHLDKLRLVKRRLAQFMNMESLEKSGIISGFFPPHHRKEVHELGLSWASLHPKNIFQWPGSQHLDMVRDYFGEEIAFFFDWLSYNTRNLLIPACLSLLSVTAPLYLDKEQERYQRTAFAFMMCAWVANLTASYDQTMTSRNIIWGMLGYADKGMVRSNYEPHLRGSFKEGAVRAFHWALVFIFVTQTIWSAACISSFRSHMLANPDGQLDLPFGMSISHSLASKLGVYAVTINIKIMNAAWGALSPRICEAENWRTDMIVKNKQVTKTFLVKCVVYYYPFFYLAFVKKLVEGCDGEDGCLEELKMNLAVFIVTHIVTVIVNVIVQVATTWWQEMAIHRKVVSSGKAAGYTYVQAQTIRPAYGGDTDDYMELSITLGFISMFSVIYPFAAFLALMSNMLEMRILAWRMCWVVRRPVPRGQEGIGAWLTVMKIITNLSCVTSVGLCIFELHPLRTLPMQTKLAVFVIAEHSMLGLVYLVSQVVPAKSVTDEQIMECNDMAEAKMLGGDSKEVQATSGNCVCMQRGAEGLTPGKLSRLKE